MSETKLIPLHQYDSFLAEIKPMADYANNCYYIPINAETS